MNKANNTTEPNERRYTLADGPKIFIKQDVAGFVLCGNDYQEVTSWSHMVRLLSALLIALDARKFVTLATSPRFLSTKDRRYIAHANSQADAWERHGQRRTSEVMKGIWVDQGIDTPKLCELMQGMLLEYGIKPADVTIYLRPK